MVDVLKIIENLKANLWEKYGDVLKREWTQDDIHMTYYAGDILERHGYQYKVFDKETYYTERAMQAAFIAGLRVGRVEANRIAESIIENRIEGAIARLKGERDD